NPSRTTAAPSIHYVVWRLTGTLAQAAAQSRRRIAFGLLGAFKRTAKQLGTDAVPFAVDLLGGRAQLPEDELRHRQRHFSLARKDGIGAGTAQRRDVPEVGRPREHLDARVGLSSQPNCILAAAHAGRTEDEGNGALGACLRHSLLMRGGAVDGPQALRAQSAH